MNRFQKKILTIAAGLANIGLALSAASVATYAWFAVNLNANILNADSASAGSLTSSIEVSGDVSLRYEVLQYDDDLKEGVSYQGDASKFKLRPYDQWIGYNHRYENAILRCEVVLDDFDASKEIDIDFTCSGEKFDGKGTNIAAETSNVVQFKSAVVSYKTAADAEPTSVNSYIEDETELGDDGKYWVADAATSYRTATEYFKRQRTSTSFVKAYKETASKYHKTITEVPYLPITGDTEVYSVIMYVECSYNTRAVENYIRNRASVSTIDLTGDIQQIKFYTSNTVAGSYQRLTPGQSLSSYDDEHLLLVNDSDPETDYANMFDATLDSADIGKYANFTQTETLNGGDLVKANSLTQKNELIASQVSGSTYTLQTNEGADSRTIGRKNNDTALQINSSATNTISNNKITSDGNTLGFNHSTTAAQNARYGYYADANVSSALYQYKSDINPSKLVSIRIVSPKNIYGIGETFIKPTVYATYASGGEVENDIKASCTFEVGGEDASTATATYGKNKRVNVYYSENGITVSNFFEIDVLSSAYLVMTPEEVTLDIDSERDDHSADLEVELINQISEPTSVTWTTSDSGVVSIDAESMSLTATATAVTIGSATITCSVVSNGHTYTATCRVVCRDTSGGTSEIEWVKVTSELDDWSGRYLIVNDDHSVAVDGTESTFSNSYFLSKPVSISDNKISGDKDFYFDIAKNGEDFYSVKTASGYYIGNLSTGSGAQLSHSTETQYLNDISFVTDCVHITGYSNSSTSTSKHIQYNGTTNPVRFSYYSTGSTSKVQLYKRTGGQAEIVSLSYGYTDPAQTSPSNQLVGVPFNPDGMEFFAQLSNGGELEIPNSSISFTTTPASITQPTNNVTVTASYGGQTIDITGVNYVNPTLTGLVIDNPGALTRTNYLEGGTFNPFGLTVYPIYNSTIQGAALDNSNDVTWYYKPATSGSWSSTFPTTGTSSGSDYIVSASYTSGGTTVNTQSASTHPAIKVYKKVLSSVDITTAPTNKYTFSSNSKFNFTGGVLTAYYNTGVTDIAESGTVASNNYIYKLCTSNSNPAGGTTITTNTTLSSSDNNKWLFVGYTYDGVTQYSTGQQITVSSGVSYSRLESINSIDSNAFYVLGIDGTGFHYSGTSSWGLTALPSSQTPLYYTLESHSNYYTAYTYVNSTKYYLVVPTSNTFTMATSTTANNKTRLIVGTTQVSGTNYAVANSSTTARHLRRNGTSGLRSYAGTTGSMAYFYKAIGVSSRAAIKQFVGDISNSQKFEISGLINYDALVQNYFDIAIGKTNTGLFYDIKQRNELSACIVSSSSYVSRYHDRKNGSITYNSARSN